MNKKNAKMCGLVQDGLGFNFTNFVFCASVENVEETVLVPGN
jgi:hypothetical protein